MPVVSDTSPISSLSAIGRLHLLKSQFGEVFLPPAVCNELSLDPRLEARREVLDAVRAGWLKMLPLKNREVFRLLSSDLHEGEAEALSLAVELKAERVLIDERDARAIATRLGLRVTGVMGVLLRAKRSGEVHSLADEIRNLREIAGFYVARELESLVLAEGGEQSGLE